MKNDITFDSNLFESKLEQQELHVVEGGFNRKEFADDVELLKPDPWGRFDLFNGYDQIKRIMGL